MMTQADLLSQNEEIFSNSNFNDKNVLTSFTTFNANSNNGSNSQAAESATATVNYERPNNLEFADLSAPTYLNEQSPIRPNRPSKYLATDSALNTSVGLRNIIIGGMIFSAIVTVALIIQIMIGTTQVPYRIGIVTQEKICSEIGSEMVRVGGKSFDAFIASSLCLGVVNPFSAGFGAGGFLLIRDHKHDKNIALNCFFKTSESLNITEYLNSPTGKKSVAIPGEFKCLETAYRYARFYWKTLVTPSIKLAREGFAVSKSLAMHLKEIEQLVKSDPLMSEIYLVKGEIAKENDIIRNERLALAMQSLVNSEREFYEGEIANNIVEKLDHRINLHDLKDYDARTEETSTFLYNDFVLMTSAFPSNGPIIKFIIEIMKSVPLKLADFQTASFYKRLLEATKLGYFMSSYSADPTFEPKLTQIYNEKLTLSKNYFNLLFSEEPKSNPEFPFKEISDYSLDDDLHVNFVSVNDHNDIMISYVGTMGSAWGSEIITKDGFFLNNGLNLYSYGPNRIKTGNTIDKNKQPRALMTPILTYNKKNPCISRFSVSYSHHGKMMDSDSMNTDDYGLTELSEVILKLFTDTSLYETAITDKRVQYSHLNKTVCYENGFDDKLMADINKDDSFKANNKCDFHSIDLIMKKDHILYSKVDTIHSNDSAVLFNKK